MSDPIKNFFLPLLKQQGVITSDNKINTASPYVSNIRISKPKTVEVTAKYSSIGKSQMRSGRSSTIQTGSTGLTSKATIKKKTLLGA